MPVIFFTKNHNAHCEGIRQALEGKPEKIHKHFMLQAQKTYKAMEEIRK